MRMHEGELELGVELVGRLLAEQFPRFAALPITRIDSTGTMNAVFRLGPQLCVRMPRLPAAAGDLERECRWLPELGPRLSLRIPEPVALGRPGAGFPHPWAIYRWIEGRPYRSRLVDDEELAGVELARFVTELRAITPSGDVPAAGRRPLRELDAGTRTAIAESAPEIDTRRALAAWEDALEAPIWPGPKTLIGNGTGPGTETGAGTEAGVGVGVWIHADLLRPNLLVDGGRLAAVIDFGTAGVGDPAADVIAAWAVFGPAGRAVFRAGLQVDDGTWRRARGYALHQAAAIIPYYRYTNPGFAALARRTVTQILADLDLDPQPRRRPRRQR